MHEKYPAILRKDGMMICCKIITSHYFIWVENNRRNVRYNPNYVLELST